MKKNEIKVGTEYAVSNSSNWTSSPFFVRRVRVTGEPVKHGGDFSWDPARYEVPAAVIQDDGTETPASIPTRDFRQDWSTYVVEQSARTKEAEQRILDKRLAAQRRLQETSDLREKFRAVVGREPEYRLDSSLRDYARFGSEIKISLTDLTALLEAR